MIKVWGTDKEAYGIIKTGNSVISMLLLIVDNHIVFLCSEVDND